MATKMAVISQQPVWDEESQSEQQQGRETFLLQWNFLHCMEQVINYYSSQYHHERQSG